MVLVIIFNRSNNSSPRFHFMNHFPKITTMSLHKYSWSIYHFLSTSARIMPISNHPYHRPQNRGTLTPTSPPNSRSRLRKSSPASFRGFRWENHAISTSTSYRFPGEIKSRGVDEEGETFGKGRTA